MTDAPALDWHGTDHTTRLVATTTLGAYVVFHTPGACLVGFDGRHIPGSPRLASVDEAKKWCAENYAARIADQSNAAQPGTRPLLGVHATLRHIRAHLIHTTRDAGQDRLHVVDEFDTAVRQLGITL